MNKGITIGAIIVLLVIVVVGAYVLTMNKSAAPYSSTIAATTSMAYTTTVVAAGTVSTTVIPANLVTPSNSSGSYAVEVSTNSIFGQYLTNSTGFTLYIDTSDVANSGTSSCTASCANVWPPFYPAELTIAPGFSTSSFGIINRTGGKSMQVTYNGYPLYFYNGDLKAGQITGNSINGGTFVVAKK